MGNDVRHALRCKLLVLAIVSSLVVSVLPSVAEAAGPGQTVMAHTGTRLGRTNAQQQLRLAVSLTVNDPVALDAFLTDLSNPASPNYKRYLTPAQFTSRFLDAASRKDVVSYLQGQGFAVSDPGVGSVVTATTTVARAETAFKVTISDYRDATGRLYYANDLTPAVPPAIAAKITAIEGLDTERQPFPASALSAPSVRPVPAVVRAAGVPCQPDGFFGAYLPDQFGTAYDFDFFTTGGRNDQGEGETVGIVAYANFTDDYVNTYKSCFGVTTPVTRVPVPSSYVPPAPAGNTFEEEVELDIETVLGMAPHLAGLRVYLSTGLGSDILNTYAAIANENIAKVSSSSFAFCELSGAQINQVFQQMAAQGQSFLAATGDYGALSCGSPASSVAIVSPASFPYVTAVGGTTLTLASGNAYGGEVVWNNNRGAGGGGVSLYWDKPAWQTGPGTNTALNPNGKRMIPDISANADPNKPYLIYTFNTFGGAWNISAGTSAASPLMAAAFARTNQYLVANGAPRLGFANPLIYRLATTNPTIIHDVTSGNICYNSAAACTAPLRYPATAGYDIASGVGSLDVGAFAPLALPPSALPPRQPTTGNGSANPLPAPRPSGPTQQPAPNPLPLPR